MVWPISICHQLHDHVSARLPHPVVGDSSSARERLYMLRNAHTEPLSGVISHADGRACSQVMDGLAEVDSTVQ